MYIYSYNNGPIEVSVVLVNFYFVVVILFFLEGTHINLFSQIRAMEAKKNNTKNRKSSHNIDWSTLKAAKLWNRLKFEPTYLLKFYFFLFNRPIFCIHTSPRSYTYLYANDVMCWLPRTSISSQHINMWCKCVEHEEHSAFRHKHTYKK